MKITKTISAAVAAASIGAFAGAAAKKAKEKGFCPLCEAKKLLNKAVLNQSADFNYNNGVALTPPMGWSSWNLFRHRINEDLIKEIADAMKNSGLADAGYTYVNIDDCWQSSERDENGRLICDKVAFRSGIKNLASYVNAQGLKLGIYSSNGTLTCEDYPASLGHEAIDADTFAEWGIEYFKYDFCHNVPIPCEIPKIYGVSVADSETGEEICFVEPSEFLLKDRAKIVNDEEVATGAYVAGYESRNGSFSVKVTVPCDGEYVLTLNIRKDGRNEKFVMVRIGIYEYHVYVPGTKSWTPEGKAHVNVKLTAGENIIDFSNPVGSKMDSAAIQYKLMGRELKRATEEYAQKNNVPEKPIVFSICEWGINRPWKWGREAGNLWRTTPDIKPVWSSVLGIYEVNVRLSKYSCVGAWNDPDMLEVGNGDLSYEENKTHFSLWCMMSAPLILGNDIRDFIKNDGSVDKENKVYRILTNKNMIAINQDALGVACRRVKAGLTDILVKPLSDSKIAVCIFNKGNSPVRRNIRFSDYADLGFVNLAKKDCYKVYDVWEEKVFESVDCVEADVMKHGVKVYIVE